jgi:hypothetical protein
MFKKTTFTLIAIGVLIAANQSSAQTAKFRAFEIQPAISLGKSCPRRIFKGVAVRDSKLQAMRSATSSWKASVRRSLSSRYADWSQAKRKRIRCSKDGIEQNYSCSALAQACSKYVVVAPSKPLRTVTVKRR